MAKAERELHVKLSRAPTSRRSQTGEAGAEAGPRCREAARAVTSLDRPLGEERGDHARRHPAGTRRRARGGGGSQPARGGVEASGRRTPGMGARGDEASVRTERGPRSQSLEEIGEDARHHSGRVREIERTRSSGSPSAASWKPFACLGQGVDDSHCDQHREQQASPCQRDPAPVQRESHGRSLGRRQPQWQRGDRQEPDRDPEEDEKQARNGLESAGRILREPGSGPSAREGRPWFTALARAGAAAAFGVPGAEPLNGSADDCESCPEPQASAPREDTIKRRSGRSTTTNLVSTTARPRGSVRALIR